MASKEGTPTASDTKAASDAQSSPTTKKEDKSLFKTKEQSLMNIAMMHCLKSGPTGIDYTKVGPRLTYSPQTPSTRNQRLTTPTAEEIRRLQYYEDCPENLWQNQSQAQEATGPTQEDLDGTGDIGIHYSSMGGTEDFKIKSDAEEARITEKITGVFQEGDAKGLLEGEAG